MERALVTGATGLVGFNIAAALLGRGRPVRALVRSEARGRELLSPGCELAVGDITEPESIARALKGCDVLYHCAGMPEQWRKDPADFERTNVEGTGNTVDAALAAGVRRFVFTSTADIFKAGRGESFDESCVDPEPKGTAYERSKQAADRIVWQAQERGLPAIFVHPTAVYGPGVHGSPAANEFFVKLYRRQVPFLLPGGMALVFAPDVGEGHVLAEEKAAAGERFILCECYVPLDELARLVCAEFGRRAPPVMPAWSARAIASVGEALANRIGRPPLIPKGQLHYLEWKARPRSDKARQQLGWKPTPLGEGIRRSLEFLGLV